ncbi:MAG: hypothetical protein M3336_13585 [Chloroflexota bacterium]|nr:hypothetical protein [Chloroflexota bacterium]
MVSRAQALVLAFLALAWVSLLAIDVAAPEVIGARFGPPEVATPLLLALFSFLLLLAIGTLRRWRWTFWLILVAFAFGPLRTIASALELLGVLPSSGPTWYVAVQGLIGLAQVAIAVAMVFDYRRAGVWGAGAGLRRSPRRRAQ